MIDDDQVRALTPGRGPVVLAVNPVAGRRRGAGDGLQVCHLLRATGFDVHVVVGRDAHDAGERIAAALLTVRPQALIVVGGDGMVHLGVNALAEGPVPLGIVASGTGNDFARLLGLPLRDPAAAVRALLHSPARTVDCGRANSTYFAGICSVGFDSAVNERANRMRGTFGRRTYDFAMVAELATFRPLDVALTLDGRRVELEAMLVAVGNGVSYGGGMRICPDARLDDGRFAITVLQRVSRREFLRVFPSVYSGRHVQHPLVQVFQAREAHVEAAAVAYADGERIGELPVHCTAMPRALRVITPGLP